MLKAAFSCIRVNYRGDCAMAKPTQGGQAAAGNQNYQRLLIAINLGKLLKTHLKLSP